MAAVRPASIESAAAEAARGTAAAASAAGQDVLHRVTPTYPRAARRRGTEGSVMLRVRIDQGGRPEEVTVVASSGSGLLDDAARSAVLRWRFRPGAAGTRDVPISFRLRDEGGRLRMSDAAPARADR